MKKEEEEEPKLRNDGSEGKSTAGMVAEFKEEHVQV
jgi:hypothetical protein